MTFLRHLVAVAALPFAVTVLVPLWLARRFGVAPSLGASAGAIALEGVGLVVLAIGLLLFIATLRLFAVRGRGTLAPWNPPSRLVVQGPYRYVRNPMISGVLFVLVAEAMLLRSEPHALWAITFLAINLVYIPLVEEPRLRRRFGEAYDDYCRLVPRIFPRPPRGTAPADALRGPRDPER
jgi:protein-S-isoprenylcysteine O-methyltransferase Ste14